MNICEKFESNVRSYCRSFPDVFDKAKNSHIYSVEGKEYIDFFAGAGALNYGHNNDYIKRYILDYIESDRVLHALDMYTCAKLEFVECFYEYILKPRGLDYKIQFCGSTGTNAVEAALKLARKVKKRTGVFAFMGGFHGMSLGGLSVTGNVKSREGAGVPLTNVTFIPFPDTDIAVFDTIDYMDSVLNDTHSGIEKPAAVIFETVQAEGGIRVAPTEWIIRLRKLCNKHDILLICDDIQVGCGRTGTFFSFERSNIEPDVVVMSKSISGYGLPMSLLLMKPEMDIWEPGEHNGTFRGNQLGFVGATAAIKYRTKTKMDMVVEVKASFLNEFLNTKIISLVEGISIRGIGMIWGIDMSKVCNEKEVKAITSICYEKGLIVERAGSNDTVIKLLPPLTIPIKVLEKGCCILTQAIIEYFNISSKGILLDNLAKKVIYV